MYILRGELEKEAHLERHKQIGTETKRDTNRYRETLI